MPEDRAFDLNRLRGDLTGRDTATVIPSWRTHVGTIESDSEMFKWRPLAETVLCHLKRLRRMVTRMVAKAKDAKGVTVLSRG